MSISATEKTKKEALMVKVLINIEYLISENHG